MIQQIHVSYWRRRVRKKKIGTTTTEKTHIKKKKETRVEEKTMSDQTKSSSPSIMRCNESEWCFFFFFACSLSQMSCPALFPCHVDRRVSVN